MLGDSMNINSILKYSSDLDGIDNGKNRFFTLGIQDDFDDDDFDDDDFDDEDDFDDDDFDDEDDFDGFDVDDDSPGYDGYDDDE
jgi:hypothetical protein